MNGICHGISEDTHHLRESNKCWLNLRTPVRGSFNTHKIFAIVFFLNEVNIHNTQKSLKCYP